MKELTTEEKAKRYDEVIKRARKVAQNPKNDYGQFCSKLLTEIFPELVESEDERIRKELITFFERFPYENLENAGLSAKDAIAWLEKQGEQKPFDYEHANIQQKDFAPKVEPKFKVGDKIQYSKGCGTIMTIEKIENGEYLFANNMGHTTIEWGNNWYLVNPVEQKPAELAKGEDYGIDGLWHAQRILEKTFGKVDGYQTDDGILSHECAISAVKELYEQKPAWSKEDENVLEDIEEAILNYWHGDTQDILLDWLKSLKERYTWKPSDEQMDALYKSDDMVLVRLYQDLKKLRKE